MRPTSKGGSTSKARRATFYLSEGLFEECRDAVVHLSGGPARLTLADLAETALRREVDRLKTKLNRGKPFPKRTSAVRVGRPAGEGR